MGDSGSGTASAADPAPRPASPPPQRLPPVAMDLLPPWLAQLRQRPWYFRAALLMGIVLVFAAIVCPISAALKGGQGAFAAALAAALCLVGALGALLISHVCNMLPPQQGLLPGILLSTAIRVGIPLGLGTAIHLSGGLLAEAGFLYYLLVFYPVTLAVETVLSLPPQPPRSAPKQQNPLN